MNATRWQEVKGLFLSAAKLEAPERPSFLEQSCAGDPRLRLEVESLLAAEQRELTLFSKPVAQDAFEALHQAAGESHAGAALGPYRIVREIGRGGSSTVYLALRDDDQYQQRVALKVIDRQLATDTDRLRFRRERQILASLDHPNIARLLDAGTTPEGLGYLVMEFVEGQPIDRYCDAQQLTVNERLKLVRTICEAVLHAHQNLVVHRDLKPSNILVQKDGTAKLLDFGIAKLLNPELTHQVLATTQPAMAMLTPLYASPEQVRGEAISTATDIYSLGVMLYELLTGRLPCRLAGQSWQELARTICEQQPERPSDAVMPPPEPEANGEPASAAERARVRGERPEGLRRALRGDLDAIVLKALHKQPRQRYASVEQLGNDLLSFLEHRPVAARPGSPVYRIAKLTMRNKLAVAAVALLIAFSGVMTLQALHIGRVLEQVQMERQKSDQVSAMLVSLFEIGEPHELESGAITIREILDRGARQVALGFADQPEVQASLMETIGTVYQNLGLFGEATPLIETSLAIRQRLHGDQHLDTVAALARLAALCFAREDYVRALAYGRQVLEARRQLLGADHPSVAESLHFLGESRHLLGDYAAAEELYRQGLEIRLRLFESGHPAVAESLLELGLVAQDQEDLATAEPLLRQALAIQRRQHGEDSTAVAVMVTDLALLLERKGELRDAESLHRRALAIMQKVLGPEHRWSATARVYLARSLIERGELEEAETLIRDALDIRHQLWPEGHAKIAQGNLDLGILQIRRGDLKAAESLLRDSVAAFRRFKPLDHPTIAAAQSELGECLSRLGRYSEAESLLLDARGMLVDRPPHQRRDLTKVRDRLRGLYEATGRPDQARRLVETGAAG